MQKLVGQKAILLIKGLNEKKLETYSQMQINNLMEYLENDIENVPFTEKKEYLNQILYEIPPNNLSSFLNSVLNFKKKRNIEFIIMFLIRNERPILQIKGLELIQKTNNDTFTAIIIPFIFSTFLLLKQQAIRTILDVPGNSEMILEQYLSNKKKKTFALRMLRKINPKNLKLAENLIKSPDFIDKIEGIKYLSKTKEKKWINKISPLLDEPDIAVRNAAIEALTNIGGKKVQKILNSHLYREPYPKLRELIIFNLNNKI